MAEGLYYTQAEYLDRYGEDEALRLTDTNRDGLIDAALFVRAIADASADIDAYLSRRYTLPLASVPRLLKSIAGALVREKLHTSYPTDAVIRDADLARKQLGDLATGKAILVDAEGAQPETGSLGPDGILTSAPARVFNATHLANY